MATQWRALGHCRALMAAAKSSTAASAAASKTAAAAAAAAARPLKGILKPLPVSKTLQDFLGGTTEASRAEAVKKVWDYIKFNNLQNPNNKKEIICDQKLKTLFSGRDTVGFLEIARLLSQHFVKKAA